jgi:hypothetical protein
MELNECEVSKISDPPLINNLKSGKPFNKKYYNIFSKKYKQAPFARCHFDGKYHLELTKEITGNNELRLAKLIFISKEDYNPGETMDFAKMGKLIKFRNLDDEEHFVTHEFYGHTMPIHIDDEGEIIIHDFQLLPYEVAKKGVSIDTYFVTVIATPDNSKIGVLFVINKEGLALGGIDLTESIGTMNTIQYENSDNETLQFKFKQLKK